MEMQEILEALGPLAPLYQETAVSEIMVDAWDTVYVSRHGVLKAAEMRFASPEAFRATIDALMSLAVKMLSPQNPVAEMHLPDEGRLIAVVPPVALNGPMMVIHKPLPHKMTWERLFEYGSITPEGKEFLQNAVHAGVSILVGGGPASGKMTVTNMLAEMIPDDKRIVVAEQRHELNIEHPHCVWLQAAGGQTGITMPELLKTASRLRPDWLVVGELLGAEALHTMQEMSRGLSGLAPIHATSPEDALARLEMLCLMANLGLGLAEIRRLIAAAIQLITYQERLADGSRKFTQFVEIAGIEGETRYKLRPLFRYNPDKGTLQCTGERAEWEKG